MTLVVCVDSRGGLLFHDRRQSQDRLLRQDLLREAAGRRLWMNAYSFRQFRGEPQADTIQVSETPLQTAGPEDLCFVENLPLTPFPAQAERLLLYCWNRMYPADRFLSPPPSWTLLRQEEFPGFSHEKITKEVYTR